MTKSYHIVQKEVWERVWDVDAPSREAAIAMTEADAEGDLPEAEFAYTLPVSQWEIEESK